MGSPAAVTAVSGAEVVVLAADAFAANTLVCLELVRPNGEGARRMTLVGRVIECRRVSRDARLPAPSGARNLRAHAQVRVAVLSADSAFGEWLAEMSGQPSPSVVPPIMDELVIEPLGAP